MHTQYLFLITMHLCMLHLCMLMSVMKRSEAQNGNRGQQRKLSSGLPGHVTSGWRWYPVSSQSGWWVSQTTLSLSKASGQMHGFKLCCLKVLPPWGVLNVGCSERAVGAPGATRSSQGESGNTVNRVSKAVPRGFHLVPWNRLTNEKHLLLEPYFISDLLGRCKNICVSNDSFSRRGQQRNYGFNGIQRSSNFAKKMF